MLHTRSRCLDRQQFSEVQIRNRIQVHHQRLIEGPSCDCSLILWRQYPAKSFSMRPLDTNCSYPSTSNVLLTSPNDWTTMTGRSASTAVTLFASTMGTLPSRSTSHMQRWSRAALELECVVTVRGLNESASEWQKTYRCLWTTAAHSVQLFAACLQEAWPDKVSHGTDSDPELLCTDVMSEPATRKRLSHF